MDAGLIRRRLAGVHERIGLACDRAGRDRDDVTLIAVTKTFPPELVIKAHEAGIDDFGENKAQEFSEKLEAVESASVGDLRWHFIGHLQRNKAKLVAGRAHLIHGVDSLRLARTLQDYADREDLSTLSCLIQVNVSGEESKFGLQPDLLPDFLREVRGHDRIRFEGLMTLASPVDDEHRLRAEFRLLRDCLDQGRDLIDTMRLLSMGMSADFELAVEEGATHVRLGSVLFGPRRA